ncbi:MAG TPA: hypothetical protein PKI69_08080, partial [Rhodocyclaceae bacterium]|nr:hypothetical protein [Rhodocyclaceae bacterium]
GLSGKVGRRKCHSSATTLTSTVTPGPRNRDAAGSLCVTNTDYLADRGKGENVYVKMCQQADGGWAPAVS